MNDLVVPDDAIVWRRVHWTQVVDDEKRPGQLRLSSGGFEDDDRDNSGMSVHYPAYGETYADYFLSIGRENEGDGIAEIRVSDLRGGGFDLKHRPEANDPRHFEVLPYPPKTSKKKKKNALCAMARMVLAPRLPQKHRH